jgi:hypothetical protein
MPFDRLISSFNSKAVWFSKKKDIINDQPQLWMEHELISSGQKIDRNCQIYRVEDDGERIPI